MSDFLNSLNPPQREAAMHLDGAQLILAGAGTGKTKVLTSRLANILLSGKASPLNIMAVTFTNKAAKEMAHRVEQLLNAPSAGMWMGTFHSISARILRRHAELAGLKPDFVIIDPDDQTRLLKELLAQFGIDEAKSPAKMLGHIISRWKDSAWTPGDLPGDEAQGMNGKGKDIYTRYQERLRELNACDFGDLLLHCVTIFKGHPDILQKYQQQFRYIMVDEYQDTNVVQYLWLRLLAMGHGNICVVGDDDQSIYGWRGAQVGNILRFEKDFPGATVVRLEQNYRSTGHILNAASVLIANNSERHGKTLWTAGHTGEPIEVRSCYDDRDEATRVTADIQGLVRGTSRYEDCAVLLRTAAQTRAFEERFVQAGVSYQVIGGLRFYERKEIRDAIAYLRIINQSSDDLAFERIVNVPRRGIGDGTIDVVKQQAQQLRRPLMEVANDMIAAGLLGRGGNALNSFMEQVNGWRLQAATHAPSELMERVLNESGYIQMLKDDKNREEANERLDNLKAMLRGMEDYQTISTFLEHVALVMDGDTNDTNSVKLMTIHAAKGLEFDNVFIPGFEDGLFPHQRSLDDSGPKALEEERRLAYVAITRAKKKLVISYAQARRMYGNYMPAVASRFLNELPNESVKMVKAQASGSGYYPNYSRGGAQPKWSQPSWHSSKPEPVKPTFVPTVVAASKGDDENSYGIGVRVFHQKFGYGRVKATDGEGPERKVVILFEKAGEKRLLESLANLEVVS